MPESLYVNGIEEDILEELNLETIPESLIEKISSRIQDHAREVKQGVTSKIAGEFGVLLSRASE